MRLGGYPVRIMSETLAFKVYQKEHIRERFRHRFEVTPSYIQTLKDHGMIFSGTSPEEDVVHIIEIQNHPFFIGTQFHPEFLSKFDQPSKIFISFVQACLN
jgi:CTP synthase